MPLAPPKRPQDLLWREVMTPLGAGRVKTVIYYNPEDYWEAIVWFDGDSHAGAYKLEDLSLIIEGECREMPPLLEKGGAS